MQEKKECCKVFLLKQQFGLDIQDLINPQHIFRDLSTTYHHINSNSRYSWVPSVEPNINGTWRKENN